MPVPVLRHLGVGVSRCPFETTDALESLSLGAPELCIASRALQPYLTQLKLACWKLSKHLTHEWLDDIADLTRIKTLHLHGLNSTYAETEAILSPFTSMKRYTTYSTMPIISPCLTLWFTELSSCLLWDKWALETFDFKNSKLQKAFISIASQKTDWYQSRTVDWQQRPVW